MFGLGDGVVRTIKFPGLVKTGDFKIGHTGITFLFDGKVLTPIGVDRDHPVSGPRTINSRFGSFKDVDEQYLRRSRILYEICVYRYAVYQEKGGRWIGSNWIFP